MTSTMHTLHPACLQMRFGAGFWHHAALQVSSHAPGSVARPGEGAPPGGRQHASTHTAQRALPTSWQDQCTRAVQQHVLYACTWVSLEVACTPIADLQVEAFYDGGVATALFNMPVLLAFTMGCAA